METITLDNEIYQIDTSNIENKLIGMIISDQNSFINVNDILTTEMFYEEKHQILYTEISYMFNNKLHIDILTLVEHLRNKNLLEKAGGVLFVNKLTTGILTSTAIRDYAKLILEKYLKRKLNEFNKLQEQRLSAEINITEEVEFMKNEIDNITSKYLGINTKSLSFTDLLLLNVETYYKKKKQEIKNEYDLKMSDLSDNLIIERGDLILLAARPSMGKTSFALQIARNYSKDNKKGLIISLEMTKNKLTSRIIIAEAEIDNKRYRTGQLYKGEEEKLLKVIREISNWNLKIEDKSGLSIAEIETLTIMQKPDYVIIDYLGLIKLPNKDSRNIELGNISHSLKGLAKRCDIPIIALHQLSRAPETRGNKRPILSDLRDSGELEQDADIIIFLYRDAYYSKDFNNKEIEIDIAKYREGSTGFVKMEHDYQIANFGNNLNF